MGVVCGKHWGEPGCTCGCKGPSDSVSSLVSAVCWGIRFSQGSGHEEGRGVSGAIPHPDGSTFPGQSFVLYQVLYIHTPPAARAILDIHVGCSCAHVTSWAKLCYRGKSKAFCLPVSMEKFSSGLSRQRRKECARVIVQRILAAGGAGMELAVGHTIGITPWLCRVTMGLGDAVGICPFLGSLHCKRWLHQGAE